ncbi:Auxin response factor 22 [Acorus gramineus]|uniref:Auxin response factor n=1 Tax=Acorus gramineus TaxID=55184 RepID=A0AAV9AQ56_ACOGR|nr:Auxin response factor 22 [Acorus gramineus]
MITFADTPKEQLMVAMKGEGSVIIERCLDSQLWHACAGGMVQMPSVNTKVYYFPQGHAEHGNLGPSSAMDLPRVPSLVLCRVVVVKFLADPETDEVYARIRLVPTHPDDPIDEPPIIGGPNSENSEKPPASFAKTLTQSDANNGGGFSVPRYCAETIFPRLDYSADPPVQTVLAKDVHGHVWKFRHIYRGTPRRHLLTTGWSTFVNQKKLVAGDSIVFLRTESGELCVGIRRAKRGVGAAIGGPQLPTGWNPPCSYGGFSMFLREEENEKMMKKGSVSAESVVEAAGLAASGRAFEVVYYPRASTPEFCVGAGSVRAAMRTQWCSGMRFKMAFETEDSSRISWFMGTISAAHVADPVRWPSSPWRLLQVTWDEPDLLQNVKRVNPWLVELVSSIPPIHLTPFSPPRKKFRLPSQADFPHIMDGQLSLPTFSGSPHGLENSTPAGIQGARHAQFGISLPDLHFDKLQTGLFANVPSPSMISNRHLIANPNNIHENISCMLSIGPPSQETKKSKDGKPASHQFLLFGQPILTEQQISLSGSRDTASPVLTENSSFDGNTEKITNFLDGSGSAIHQYGAMGIEGRLPWYKDRRASEIGLEIAL